MTPDVDMRERLVRVETKLDMLLEVHKRRRTTFISIVSVIASAITTGLVTLATRHA